MVMMVGNVVLMLIVAGSQIVCFLKRRTDLNEEPVDKEEEKISKLWSNGE